MNNTLEDSIAALNKKYDTISFMDRLGQLFKDFDSEKILVTTSLGTTSVVLLHMLSKVAPDHPVYCIDTGYLFDETHQYKEQLRKRLNLNIIDIKPDAQKHAFTKENKTFAHNNDFCCFVNKVEPMQKLKKGKEVWVSGVFRYQNANRAKLNIFEYRKGPTKFHPIIDMAEEDVKLYMSIHELPNHPLLYQGYGSLGCVHCTAKGDGREGRWLNTQKTECGLHR
jgi:phosphoadenosine phosphosulfate reductase